MFGGNINPAAKAPAPTVQGAAPNADQGAEPKSVTLTAQPDGTIMCDDGSGEQPSVHNSIDDALDYAKTKLGGGGEEPGDAEGSEPFPDNESGPDFSAAYSKG